MIEWISTKDKLPNDLDRIDLLINKQRRLVDCTYADNSFYTHESPKEYWTKIENNVTHWMPIPELPIT